MQKLVQCSGNSLCNTIYPTTRDVESVTTDVGEQLNGAPVKLNLARASVGELETGHTKSSTHPEPPFSPDLDQSETTCVEATNECAHHGTSVPHLPLLQYGALAKHSSQQCQDKAVEGRFQDVTSSTEVDHSTRTSEIHEAAVLVQDVSGIQATIQRAFSEVQLLEAGARLKLPSQEVLGCSSV